MLFCFFSVLRSIFGVFFSWSVSLFNKHEYTAYLLKRCCFSVYFIYFVHFFSFFLLLGTLYIFTCQKCIISYTVFVLCFFHHHLILLCKHVFFGSHVPSFVRMNDELAHSTNSLRSVDYFFLSHNTK